MNGIAVIFAFALLGDVICRLELIAPRRPDLRGQRGLRTRLRAAVRFVPTTAPLACGGEAIPFSNLTEATASGSEWVVGLA